MAEACRVMARDVGLEKAKVQQLESRLSEAYPSIDSLLAYLAPGELNRRNLRDEGLNGHLLLENHRQRELIVHLESNLQKREEAIRELKLKLEEPMHELQLARSGQAERDGLSPDNMTGNMSEESGVEIITENAQGFIGY